MYVRFVYMQAIFFSEIGRIAPLDTDRARDRPSTPWLRALDASRSTSSGEHACNYDAWMPLGTHRVALRWLCLLT